ncbi:MAG: hypothetical protein HQL66_07995 [Magnetococcales bacterium]|nr:hypothetical protein [Magnetococcales bacterium]
MDEEKEAPTPLNFRSTEPNPEKPFDGDLFGRKALADRLTGMIGRLTEGCVLAIDAPWGEGKSWFGKNWANDLRQKGYRVAFIDAFRQDYVEDPFLMLCAEVLPLVREDEGERSKLAEVGAKVTRNLIPISKSLANSVFHSLLAKVGLANGVQEIAEIVAKGTIDIGARLVVERLENHAQEKKSVEEFANLLGQAAAREEKPLVIFIDELDRCRPDFAMRTVERIKHFFDVPKVIFVLLVNRRQLEAAVRGLYGNEIDAETYLGKFVLAWIGLPKADREWVGTLRRYRLYCDYLVKKFGLDRDREHDGFCVIFTELADFFELSLRDMERGFVIYSLAQPLYGRKGFTAWAIFLKLYRQDICVGVINGNPKAHEEAINIVEILKKRKEKFYLIPSIEDLHRLGAKIIRENEISDQTKKLIDDLYGNTPCSNEGEFLPWLFARINPGCQIE